MAQISGSARRYAAAIFELAREGNAFETWVADLARVVEILTHPDAERLLTSPAVPEDERIAALGQLVPGLSAPARSLVDILARRGRLELVPQVLLDFQRRLDELRGIADVQVTTAVPLDQESERLLTQRLTAFTGKQVRLEKQVDPDILGGVIARIGDELLDDSVRGRLDRLHRRLVGGIDIAR
jgi:F-type H+-transporting ATPase subunit delta